jgi:copper chaperone
MAQLTFKTNIKCGGCIATVKPHLDQLEGIKSWTVDTASPEKKLTVETDITEASAIINTLSKAGYKAEIL